MPRPYDLVLFGAGGFTGRQTVAHLARHPDAARLRWAIAGRHRARLEAARDAAGEGARGIDLLVADSADPASVDAVVSRTRVLATTAGPFARYGTPVVDACVRHDTHYADITGETPWVRGLIERHHERAAARGTRLVPFCGFDSVPSDLGAFLLARHAREAHGVGVREVHGFFRMAGGLNGGTIATVLDTFERGLGGGARDPFLLDPPVPHSEQQRARSQDVRPPFAVPALGAWAGPFFMAPTNTRVVRRSAALHAQWGEPYGAEFTYEEYLAYRPPLAGVKAMLATGALGLFGAALAWRPTRRLVARALPRPGEGPSEATMNGGWFTCDHLATTTDGRTLRARIANQGDPGNRSTVTFLCEAALALALDGDALPGGPTRGGVLTPATALGDVLAGRLRRAGVTIDVG